MNILFCVLIKVILIKNRLNFNNRIKMDVSRAVLDNLMGRDRNKPNDLIT